MQASNTNANLQGVDRDLVVGNVVQLSNAIPTLVTPYPTLTTTGDISSYSYTLTDNPAQYSPNYVTRAEYNDLLARIAQFNARSPQPI